MSSLRYFGAFFCVAGAILLYLLVRVPQLRLAGRPAALWGAACAGAAYAAWSLTGQTAVLGGLLMLVLVVALALRRLAPDLTATGHGLVVASIGLSAGMASWTLELTASFGWPAWLANTVLVLQSVLFLFAFFVTTPLRVLSMGDLGVRQTRRDEALARLARHPRTRLPKVCVQVPCYSEPPELVIATLDAIARLDYPDFEVIVIDNNTKDPALWRPVQAHCARLGERFRFFHVDRLQGAKAGALNHIAPHVSSDVELVAVVDADYIVQPDFLKRWSPLFEDPKIGFVQTTHEYRDWAQSGFLARFYPVYVIAHKLMLPSLTQIGGEFTVGTMCLVRRSALQAVGGWAEWCQTEDSELAVRLHAQGYRGYYFAEPCGHGLIPETLDRMRKQRFRWAYGPMQQLRHHWRLYFGLSKQGRLSWQQRCIEIVHSFEHTPSLMSALLHLPLLYAVYREVFTGAQTQVGVDYLLFVAAVIVLRRLVGIAQLTMVGRCNWLDVLLYPVTQAAIQVYEAKGTLCAMFGLRWPWQRTDKFPVTGSLRRAASIVRVDLLLLAKSWLVAAWLYPYASFEPVNYTGLLVVILAMVGSLFLVSAGLCFFHEIDLKLQQRRTVGIAARGVVMPQG